MADLGNAWHIPANPEPRGRGGMCDPVGAIVSGAAVTLVTGNQYQGGGNAGNQLQDGSAVLVRQGGEQGWTTVPLKFLLADGNNKYFQAGIVAAGGQVQYYFRIAYDDHDTTFLHDGAATGIEDEARRSPYTFVVQDPAVRGRWDPVFPLPNVAVHAHVLPDGDVLMWGRRDQPGDSLNVHSCTPFVWSPGGGVEFTAQPTDGDGNTVNLFCSGHAFLADGRLLVVGGHLADGDGLAQAALFDWRDRSWTPAAPMTGPDGQPVRRWYPTATTLPGGGVLVFSGSFRDPARPPETQVVVADLIQVWEDGGWRTVDRGDGTPLNFFNPPLYPRMHVVSDGRVFMSGPNVLSQLLRTATPGGWAPAAVRQLGARDYCPSVSYDVDKILAIGGGNDVGTLEPTNEAETIDLAGAAPQWVKTPSPMTFARRQHNAVLLPDGKVLVVGGTRGGGFNDLGPGAPVHIAEMWEPATKEWTELSAETRDRCYHATAVLLPDARVLSAGGGEYFPDGQNPNDPRDSHRDAQIFSPPYLFQGARPEISAAPAVVGYGDDFEIETADPESIDRVSWIRLPSATHSFDENQRINFLASRVRQQKLIVTAPATAQQCPPGHYMLFILAGGVPSVARIVQIAGPAAARRVTPRAARVQALPPIAAREAEVVRAAHGTAVRVGITGTCPYGIGSCWGAAYEALGRLEGVDLVSPVPDVADSTAEVFLRDDRLPDLAAWERQFPAMVNGSYELRGVEIQLSGVVEQRGGELILAGDGLRPPVAIVALGDKIQWDQQTQARRPAEEAEITAFERLRRAAASGELAATVTGPLTWDGAGYRLHLRATS